MKPPWSTNQLKRLGDALRDEAAVPSSLPDYAEVIGWYDELATEVHSRIESLGLEALDGVADVEISSRAKTIGTLRDKLRREWPIRLPSIQDIAGVRVTADMSMTTQNEVATRIANEFGHEPDSIRDTRSESHSGYRAVHLWLRLDEGRVEVQVRTKLQSMWANAYEALADIAGRGIRYGEPTAWAEGVPEYFKRSNVIHDEAVDFPSAMRRLSTQRLSFIETMRMFAEAWSLSQNGPAMGEPAISAALDGLRLEWESHPLLGSRPNPEIDGNDPDAPRLLLAAISELEQANVTMLVGLRDGIDEIRRDVRGGGTL